MAVSYNNLDYSRNGGDSHDNVRAKLKEYQKLIQKRHQLLKQNHKLAEMYAKASPIMSKYNQQTLKFLKLFKHDPNLFSTKNERRMKRGAKWYKKQAVNKIKQIQKTSVKINTIKSGLKPKMSSDDQKKYFKPDMPFLRFEKQLQDYKNHKNNYPGMSIEAAKKKLKKDIFAYGRNARQKRTKLLDHPDKITLDDLVNVPGLSRALGVDKGPQNSKFSIGKGLAIKWPKWTDKPVFNELKRHVRSSVYSVFHHKVHIYSSGYDNYQNTGDPYIGKRGFTQLEQSLIMPHKNLREIFGLRDEKADIKPTNEHVDNHAKTVDGARLRNVFGANNRQDQLGLNALKRHEQIPLKSFKTSDMIDMQTQNSPLQLRINQFYIYRCHQHAAKLAKAKFRITKAHKTWRKVKSMLAAEYGLKGNQGRSDAKSAMDRINRRIQIAHLQNQIDDLRKNETKPHSRRLLHMKKQIKRLRQANKNAHLTKPEHKYAQMAFSAYQNAKNDYKEIKGNTPQRLDLAKMIREDTDNQRVARYQKRLRFAKGLRNQRLYRYKLQQGYKANTIYLHKIRHLDDLDGRNRGEETYSKRLRKLHDAINQANKRYEKSLKKRKQLKKRDHSFPNKKIAKEIVDECLDDFSDRNGNIPLREMHKAKVAGATEHFKNVTMDKLSHDYATRNLPIRDSLKQNQKSHELPVHKTMSWGQAILEMWRPGITETYGLGKHYHPELDPVDTSALAINHPSNAFEKHFARVPGQELGFINRFKARVDQAAHEHQEHIKPSHRLYDPHLGKGIGKDYFGSSNAAQMASEASMNSSIADQADNSSSASDSASEDDGPSL